MSYLGLGFDTVKCVKRREKKIFSTWTRVLYCRYWFIVFFWNTLVLYISNRWVKWLMRGSRGIEYQRESVTIFPLCVVLFYYLVYHLLHGKNMI